ncbi:MAG: endonuclease, partial [Planctomycetota bacterium]|nr:endonuclease [Planctomycetota bacterium]
MTRKPPLIERGTVVTFLLCLPLTTLADPPPGYYDSIDAINSTTLRTTLHAVIEDHLRFPYTSSSTDTWNILNLADEDPNDSGNILDVYRNASYPKISGGTRDYNREHTWPKSYGFPDNTSSNYPYTDCHMLFLCNGSYNSSRGNNPYRDCHGGCTERTTLANNGQGGGSGEYPGNSNWRTGSGSGGTWETWIGRRGDVARALFYADVRYEGGAPEPDLILTDDTSLIAASNTGDNEPIAYMGILTVLLQWHVEDPVDDVERDRTDVVFSFQNNRNPFIDHPEWVVCLFIDECDAGCPQDLDGDGLVEAFDLA